MKKISFFIIGFSVLFNYACRLDKLDVDCLEHVTFDKKYTEAHDFKAHDIKETTDGRYIICGSVNYDTDEDIFLMKVDKEGEVIFFESERNTSTDEVCNSIVVTKDRGFLICGQSDNKAYFAKYNFRGQLLEDNRVDLFDAGECRCITETTDDFNYTFSGRAGNPTTHNSYVGLLNLQGQVPNVLTHYLPNPRDGAEDALAVIPSKGGYTVVGHSYNAPENEISTAMHFVRLDENFGRIFGTEQFYHLGTQQDIAHGVVETPDGNYMITGDFHGQTDGENVFVLEVNHLGEMVNRYQYGGPFSDRGVAIIEAHEADQYIVVGFSEGSSGGDEDMYLAKIKRDGTPVWERTFGETNVNERADAVIRTECDGYIVTGFTINADETKDVLILKVDADGNVK